MTRIINIYIMMHHNHFQTLKIQSKFEAQTNFFQITIFCHTLKNPIDILVNSVDRENRPRFLPSFPPIMRSFQTTSTISANLIILYETSG
jgi:hypothetical protein